LVQGNKSGIISEVDKRLDDLFGGSENSAELFKENIDFTDSPLRELKAIVLSIDWEIDDEIMTGLIEELMKLEKVYQNDKVSLMFIQLLGSTGKYIKANKANAHPDSINVLMSVYQGFEKVVQSKGITDQEKKKTLLAEVEKFKALKEQIASKKVSPGVKKEVKKPPKEMEAVIQEQEKETVPIEEIKITEETPEEVPRVDAETSPMQEAFVFALDEIKQAIKDEFKALREELHSWREGK
jgi:hypothetical protein